MKSLIGASIATSILTVSLLQTSFAQYQENSDSSQYNNPNSSWNQSSQNQENWEQKKLEKQKRSTEMRQNTYAMMKEKGYDVSSLSDDLLDGSKTDESEFWMALEKIKKAKDGENRAKIAKELSLAGHDTSKLTNEILDPYTTEERVFWEVVKTVKDNEGVSQARPRQPKPMEMQVQRSESNENRNTFGASKNPNAEWGKSGERQEQKPSVLSKAAREKLIKTLTAISEEKKAATLETMRAKIQKQMEVAKSKKQKLTYRKLEETLRITEEYLQTEENEMSDDELINQITE